jgi:hypothetical protein
MHALLAWYWSDACVDAAAAAAAAVAGAAGAAVAGSGGGGSGGRPPLVINTHGWVSGVGLDMLCELLRGAAPTHGEGGRRLWLLCMRECVVVKDI